MAIKLEVKPYCADCCDFEADVVKPERVNLYAAGENDPYVSLTRGKDTVVRCKYARRCESLVRYLHQSKAEEGYEQLQIGDVT